MDNWIKSNDFKKTFFTLNTLLDLLICVPIIVLLRIPNGIYYFVPYYLRILVCLEKLADSMRLLESSGNFGASRERLFLLISYMFTIVYISMCSFWWTEYYYGTRKGTLTLQDAFYFTIVTISVFFNFINHFNPTSY